MTLRSPDGFMPADPGAVYPALQMRETREQQEKRFDESPLGGFIGKYFSFVRDRIRHIGGLEVYNPDLYSAETLAKVNNERTPFERVKAVFVPDPEDSDFSTGHMLTASEVFFMGAVGGAVYGVLVGIKGIRERFIQVHQATIFERPQEAKNRLVDTLVFHGARSGVKYGMKVGALAAAFSISVAVITALRNKSGILEYTCSGFLMGAIWRTNMGLSGMLAGGCLGAALGTLGGSVCHATQRITHKTYEEIAYWKRAQHMHMFKDAKMAGRNGKPDSVETGPIRMHDVFKQANLLDNMSVKKPDVYPTVNLPHQESEHPSQTKLSE